MLGADAVSASVEVGIGGLAPSRCATPLRGLFFCFAVFRSRLHKHAEERVLRMLGQSRRIVAMPRVSNSLRVSSFSPDNRYRTASHRPHRHLLYKVLNSWSSPSIRVARHSQKAGPNFFRRQNQPFSDPKFRHVPYVQAVAYPVPQHDNNRRLATKGGVGHVPIYQNYFVAFSSALLIRLYSSISVSRRCT